jgi:hypothetical protein
MTMSDAVSRTLWLAIEDYSGLWEAVWELNTARPAAPADSNRSIAREAVEYLLEREWVQIYRVREPDGSPTPVTADEARRLLDTPSSWEPPCAGGTSIRIGATEKGEEAYRTRA